MLQSFEAQYHGLRTIGQLSKYLGVTIIRTSACPITSITKVDIQEGILTKIKRVLQKQPRLKIEVGGNGHRSTLFVPNVAFGLVAGRDLTMEVQRRNELQAIHVTGTQRVAGVVKNKEATCRISHA